MSNLSDEPTPLVVDNVPGKGTAQLRNAECVDGTACVFLRADVRQPPAVTSDERPHGNSRRSRLVKRFRLFEPYEELAVSTPVAARHFSAMRMFVRRPSSRSVVAVQLSSVAAPSLGLKVSFAGSLSRRRRADAPFTGWVARHVGRLSAAVAMWFRRRARRWPGRRTSVGTAHGYMSAEGLQIESSLRSRKRVTPAQDEGLCLAAVVELTDHGLLVAVVQRNGSSDPARSLRRRTARWFVSATRMAVAR
jgi:hypothetical protein